MTRVGNKDILDEINLVKLSLDKKTSYDPVEHNDKTRSRIATDFVWFYFAIVLIIIVFGMFKSLTNHAEFDVQEILGLIGTLIGSPLGFVLGYYFKNGNGN